MVTTEQELAAARDLVRRGKADAVPPHILEQLGDIGPIATATSGATRPGGSAERVAGGFVAVGEVAARFMAETARRRERWQAEAAAFLAAGGDCAHCWDRGFFGADPCPYCERGRSIAASQAGRQAELFVAQAGLRPFDGRDLENWPIETGDGAAIEEQRWGILLEARHWLDAPGRPWLFLCGPKGNGKSSLAAALLRERIWRTARPGLRLTEAEFMALLKPGDDQDTSIRFAAQRTPALVLDDLGTEKESQFTEGERFALINARYEHRRWTVITSNIPFAHPRFVAAIGERVHDRLREMCQVLTVPGSSLRH